MEVLTLAQPTPSPARRSKVSPEARDRITALFNEGASLSRITQALNTSDLTPPRGGAWTVRTVVRVLQSGGLYEPSTGGTLFDARVASLIRELHEAGGRAREIAEKLEGRGVRSLSGDSLTPKQIDRWLRRQGLVRSKTDSHPADRFARLVSPQGGCQVWNGPTHPDGHGVFNAGGKMVMASRYAYELAHGPLGQKRLKSTCPLGNKLCVAPDHHRVRGSFEEEFRARIGYDAATGCRPWLGPLNAHGYGQVKGPGGKPLLAHRVSYELRHGPLSPGSHLHHVCRNRPCTETSHLIPAEDGAAHADMERLEQIILRGAESGDLFRELDALRFETEAPPHHEERGT